MYINTCDTNSKLHNIVIKTGQGRVEIEQEGFYKAYCLHLKQRHLSIPYLQLVFVFLLIFAGTYLSKYSIVQHIMLDSS